MSAAAATVAGGPPVERGGTHPLLRLGSRVVLPAVLTVLVLLVLAYAVFPTRAWVDQGAEINERQAELVELESRNVVLEERMVLLSTTHEIERMARRDHGLVLPGEEAYAVLPAAPAPVRLPPAWPFTELPDALD
jgi:cell division protein FtsB